MVRAVVTGVGIAGGGLFIGTALKLAKPIQGNWSGIALAVACFALVAVGRVSLFIVLPVAALVAWLAARKGAL
jgi:chromate transporter